MFQNVENSQHIHLRFHQVRSNDIVFYHNRSVVKRTQTNSTSGLVFTSRPVKINEKIAFKLLELSEDVDVLSIGFTSKDPSILARDLSSYNVRELKDKPEFWICKICKLNEKCSVKNKILFFYIDNYGTVRYGINDKEKGTFDRKISLGNNVWGFIALKSAPTTIQLLNHFKCLLQPLMLHQTRGRNVKLVRNTAFKVDDNIETSYAFTSRPLSLNERVVIKILGGNKSSFTLGLTSCNPSSLYQQELPLDSYSFVNRAEYWMLIKGRTWNLKKNDEISFSVKSNGFVKIIKNSSTILKVVRVHPELHLWGLFDFGSSKGIQVDSCALTASEDSSTRYALPSAPPPTLESEIKNNAPNDKKVEKKLENEILSNEGKVEENQEVSECVICCENSIEAALYPCGHMCMCYDCAQKQWQSAGHCPLCRATATDVLKIYKS